MSLYLSSIPYGEEYNKKKILMSQFNLIFKSGIIETEPH